MSRADMEVAERHAQLEESHSLQNPRLEQRPELRLLHELSAAVGENARLQAALHAAFASHLSDSRRGMAALEENIRVLQTRLDSRPSAGSDGPAAALAVGDNLLLVKVLSRFLMYLEASDMSLTPHLATDCIWEPRITEAFTARLRPGITVVDVGANVGYYSLLAGSHVGLGRPHAMSAGRVHAFEPHPRTFEILTKNIRVNGLEQVVKAYPIAAVDSPRQMALRHPRGLWGDASLLHPAAANAASSSEESALVTTMVNAMRLDDVLSGPVDLIKIDAEGSEPLVLKGMTRIMEQSPNVTIFLEFFEPLLRQICDPREFLAEFSRLGFTTQWFTPWGTLEPFDPAQALAYPRFDLLLERGNVRPDNRKTTSSTLAPSLKKPATEKVSAPAPAKPVAAVPEDSSEFTAERFAVLHRVPIWMTISERVILYATIAGLRPQRCLEIGTFRGGSAMIIVSALDDLGSGRLACVDPQPQIEPAHWNEIAHRATLFSAPSPAVLAQATASLGGKIDFALVDGDHSTAAVIRDLQGLLPYLADDACLLLHDAHNAEVIAGVHEVLSDPANGLRDCGLVSTEKTPDPVPGVFWGGLRMLRFRKP